jgi:hypothetical protein
MMIGSTRPTVSLVAGPSLKAGLISVANAAGLCLTFDVESQLLAEEEVFGRQTCMGEQTQFAEPKQIEQHTANRADPEANE